MTNEDEPRVPVNFRDTPTQIERVNACAAREQRSRSQMLRVMVAEYLNNHSGTEQS
jgi:metal-responsive CopG/Arc/MetJ family transcriptional regulator